MNPQAQTILIGIGIAAVIGIIRIISVSVTRMFTDLTDIEAKVSRLEFSNGLTAIVLSQLPRLVDGVQSFTDPYIYSDLIVPAVLTTALFGSLISPILYKGGFSFQQAPEEPIEAEG